MELSILSNKDGDGKRHQMLIDYQEDSIGFIVLYNDAQIDFAISKADYQLMKTFIEYAIHFEKSNKTE